MKVIITVLFAMSLVLGPIEKKKEKTVTITVTINGLQNSSGMVGARLLDDSGDFPEGEAIMEEGVSAKSGSIEVIFKDVPEGDYAIAVLHDANENSDMDYNDQGMPLEGFGFSNDAMGDMGPPDFDQAAFTADEDLEIEINLIYMAGGSLNNGK